MHITRRDALLALGAGVLYPEFQGARTQGSRLRFEIYQGRGGFWWRLKAGNGQIVATSGQGYKSKAACRDGVDLVMRGAAAATIEEV